MSDIALILGIRPDVIRANKIIKLLDGFDEFTLDFIWSGQHYSDNMKDIFFSQLNVRSPDYEFNIDRGSDAEIVSSTIKSLSDHFNKHKYKAVIFLGDTNTVMGSVAAAQHNIPIIHIEGCMRSYDWRMPEEKYRTTVDHLSDRIYAYLDSYKAQGLNEGIGENRIMVTGNPIVDIVFENRDLFSKGPDLVDKTTKEITEGEYVLATCHRRENILDAESLHSIIDFMNSVPDKIIFPMGYKTQEQLKESGLKLNNNVYVSDPIGYIEFMYLLVNSKYVISDSGTVVEEACILGVPSVQVRKSTERPEVYEVKASVKFDPTNQLKYDKIISDIEKLVGTKWENPFGDGTASEKIAKDIRDMYMENSFRRHSREDYPFSTDRSYMS
tara:strand:+ start:323 stop:1474 length:1152 start_codon:yes stop_codon:yes gene_type:complete